MARLAGKAVRMTRSFHLRKTLRLRSARFMALSAQLCCVELCRLNGRIVGMRSERPVARLAADQGMLSRLLLVRYICVAGLASLVACKMNRLRGDLARCGSAVVPILSKCVWHQPAADGKKCEDCDHKNSRKSKQMSGIAEAWHRSSPRAVITNDERKKSGFKFRRMLENARQQKL